MAKREPTRNRPAERGVYLSAKARKKVSQQMNCSKSAPSRPGENEESSGNGGRKENTVKKRSKRTEHKAPHKKTR